MLLADLANFVDDHRLHGRLTADGSPPSANGYRLTVVCSCGGRLERWVTADDAQVEMTLLARWS